MLGVMFSLVTFTYLLFFRKKKKTQLKLHFQLVAVLREVRYLKYLERDDIPEVATNLYNIHEMFRNYVANLDLTVAWYNEVCFVYYIFDFVRRVSDQLMIKMFIKCFYLLILVLVNIPESLRPYLMFQISSKVHCFCHEQGQYIVS